MVCLNRSCSVPVKPRQYGILPMYCDACRQRMELVVARQQAARERSKMLVSARGYHVA